MTTQRIRVWFRKGERVRYISHLDVLRYWERAIRRAGLPLAYSQGFTPHPKITFAAPLPLGFIGEAEIMDATLSERVDVDEFARQLAAETSEDIDLLDAREVAPSAPATQAALRWASYAVDVLGVSVEGAKRAIEEFLARDTFEWTDKRGDKTRTIDLRAAVAELAAASNSGGVGGVRLQMRLACTQELTARPEQVLAAIFPEATPGTFVRTELVLSEPSVAREAWRRKGRYL